MEQQFTALDTDKNGQVSLAEFKAAATARVSSNPAAALQRFDANKDGKVSAAEFRAPALADLRPGRCQQGRHRHADEARKRPPSASAASR